MDSNAAEKLQEVFRAVFELPPDADVTRLRQMTTAGWDSLAHVALVTAIESEFGLTLEVGEQLELTSYNAASVLLEGRLA
ncbi:MAG: acyl carrier protein [Gemmatimonadaceae bacterium]